VKISGAIAVVTGGGSGIGRALALALGERGARHVVVTDVNKAAAGDVAAEVRQKQTGAAAAAICLDVIDPAAVAAAVAAIENGIGPIGLWFSNAGVNRGKGLGSPEDWSTAIGVNLLGHVHGAAAVIPLMAGRGEGHFIVTASAAGLLTDLRSAPYSASKHAAVGLSEWLAINAPDGVGVSCVCPEGVRTAMTRPDSGQLVKDAAFLEADEVADTVLDAVELGDFLVLTHPRTAEYEGRRVADRARWLKGMRKTRMPASEPVPASMNP
jgi:NAD(P)-dependent dehydrogenase (short-subunit alcohol dehydrogenase family)